MSVRGHNKTDRLIMYDRIHRYRKEDHRSVSWIAQKLQLNRRTVKRYLAVSGHQGGPDARLAERTLSRLSRCVPQDCVQLRHAPPAGVQNPYDINE